MSAQLFLGLDVGTQGTKALVVELEGRRVVARASAAYELLPDLPPGAAEQHPDTWWEAVRACLRGLAGEVDLACVRGVGVSGQQHGFVPLDAQHAVIRAAKLWCDTSTAAEAHELSERLGRSVPTGFTASKILWLARNEPENYARLAHVLLPHDWINYRLTGVLAMEAGDASGTGLLDVAARRFDARACAAVDPGLQEMLPALVAPGRPLGGLTAEAAAELGLVPGTPVAPGGGDNMCAAIGSGATRPGVAVLSLGTSATVFAFSETPVLDPEGSIAGFCDSTGGYLPLLCVMNATGLLHEVARGFGGLQLDVLTRAAAEVPAGCDGMMILPYLNGERVPDLPHASATLLGWRAGMLAPGRLFRAALEGVSLNLAWGVRRMRGLGIGIDAVRLVGGGASNDLWARILASCLGLQVQRLAEDESAALGAAIQAAWVVKGGEIGELCAGFVRTEGEALEPEEEWRKVYAEAAVRFEASVGNVFPASVSPRDR